MLDVLEASSAVLQEIAAHWISVALIALFAGVLGAFDIALPRGDSVGVGGSLEACSLVLFGPLAGLLAVGAAASGGALAFKPSGRASRRWDSLMPKSAGLIAAVGVGRLVSIDPAAAPPLLPAAVVLATYLLTEQGATLARSAYRSDRSLLGLLRGGLHMQAPFLLAQLSAATLLLLIYPGTGDWSLLVVGALLILIRQSYSMLLEIRETFRTTVEVLAEVAEASTSQLVGHAERTAHIARDIATRCGMSPVEVDRLSYAALLHDIGSIGDEGHVKGRSADACDVLAGLSIFEDVVRVLRVGHCDSVGSGVSDQDRLAAFIVAVASDIDGAKTGVESHVGLAHGVAPDVPPVLKAKVVHAAVSLGYGIPALP